MAQRYPSDFDGVFARVPVINWVGLQHAYLPPNLAMMQPGGWLSPAHVAVLGNYVNVICDVDDGAADGIIGDSNTCGAKIDFAGLKCSPGQASDTCLNDAQIRAAKLHHARYQFDFPLANGVRSYPGRGLGGEATPGTGSTGGWVTWMTGQDPPAWPATAKNSNGWNYGSGTIAHFILRDANADVMKYNPNDHRARIVEISALMDSTNPDLSAFRERGGKVIILEYMADYAQSPFAGIEYFQSVQKKMGAEKTNEFVRLFVAPGVDHVGTGAPGNVDMLAALEEWVERGAAPTNLTVIEQPNVAPFGTRRSRPLCEWPLTPKHTGKGNPGVAASWVCVK
jgi:Tannase and feruloyl esterase